MKNFNSSILKAKINQQLFRYRLLIVTYLATLKISSQSWGIFKLVKEDLPSVQFLNLIFPTCQLRLRPACLYFRNTRSNVLIESKERETNKLYRNVWQLWTVKLLLYLVAILFLKMGQPRPLMWKNVNPSSIRRQDSNPRPFVRETRTPALMAILFVQYLVSVIRWLDYFSVWSDG